MYPIQVTEDFTAHRHATAGSAPRAEAPRPYDVFSAIVAFECGELNDDQDAVIELFQHLVDTGMAWRLQGCYGRAAANLIAAGLITDRS